MKISLIQMLFPPLISLHILIFQFPNWPLMNNDGRKSLLLLGEYFRLFHLTISNARIITVRNTYSRRIECAFHFRNHRHHCFSTSQDIIITLI